MDLDANAVAKIKELEAQINDLHVIVDLQREEISEIRAENKALKGQLSIIRTDRRAEVA